MAHSSLARTLVIYQGADLLYALTVRDEDDNLLDLSGSTLTFQVRETLDGDVVLEASTGAGITHAPDQTGVGMGLADLAIEGDDTADLEGIHWYGLWLTDALGNAQPLRERGSVHIKVPVVQLGAS